jgi:hypothetical protein
MLLVKDARLQYPVVVDLYRATSSAVHEYDYPIHFRGQYVTGNTSFSADSSQRRPLGNAFGFQHIWREAQASSDSTVSVTWLTGNRYYTVTTAASPNTALIFGRTGAHDPNFNLIVEPMVILRRHAAATTFASVIEPHGYFNELEERSAQARPQITSVKVVSDAPTNTVLDVTGDNALHWVITITDKGFKVDGLKN